MSSFYCLLDSNHIILHYLPEFIVFWLLICAELWCKHLLYLYFATLLLWIFSIKYDLLSENVYQILFLFQLISYIFGLIYDTFNLILKKFIQMYVSSEAVNHILNICFRTSFFTFHTSKLKVKIIFYITSQFSLFFLT